VESARGRSAYRFLILLPEQREQQFVGTLAILLQQQGIDLHRMDEVAYRYRLDQGRLTLEVIHAIQKGRTIAINRSSYL
jgi:hypothetical protein